MSVATEPRTPNLADLRQRILDGGTVTEDEYARAKTLAELDELQAIAEQQAAQRQAAAERKARFDDLRARAQAITDQREQRDALAEQLRGIVAEMVRLQDAMQTEQSAIINALGKEGIRPGEQEHGIGWAHANAFTRADHICLEDARITAGVVRVPIEDALGGALADTGKNIGYLGTLTPARPR